MFFGILVAFFSFAGSNGDYYNMPGYWFLTIISIYYILNLESFNRISLNNVYKFKKIGLALVIFISIFSIFTKDSCFYDSTNKISLNTTIKNHMFWGSYTTKERADVLKDFINTYPRYINWRFSFGLAFSSFDAIYNRNKTDFKIAMDWGYRL